MADHIVAKPRDLSGACPPKYRTPRPLLLPKSLPGIKVWSSWRLMMIHRAHPVPTAGGCTLMAEMDGDIIMPTDENGCLATVTIADVKQSKGVIHVIDCVLLPKQ
ncbi:MAG: putative surface protein with fasciclin (FAS1) repeats [Paracoccaceae bacterium]|jgi:uncharacterized surface protein with fasciclin (FAS1) repeats